MIKLLQTFGIGAVPQKPYDLREISALLSFILNFGHTVSFLPNRYRSNYASTGHAKRSFFQQLGDYYPFISTGIEQQKEVLNEMMGFNDEFMDFGQEIPMYVLSNTSRVKGAAQVLDTEAITSYFSTLTPCPKRLVLIPSSIHEWIIVPTSDEDIDLDAFATMINEVNMTEVDAVEQLGNHAYVIEL